MFTNQVVIVTGATRGIGRAAVERFASEGAAVVGVYSGSVDLAARLEAEYTAKGRLVRMVQGSVDDAEFVAELMKQTQDEFGRIDVLVNNAGITRDSLMLMMSGEQWDDVLRVNYSGVFRCCTAVLPYMRERRSGSIVNVVSVTGLYGREAQINYAASKGAVIGLTKLLARRYAGEDIRINAVAPGMVETDMIGSVPEPKMEAFLQHTHLRRTGRPTEIADAILFLAGGQSTYISGQVLKIDGGFLL